ncbi:MAG TPA: amidase family protein [Acidimicrobiales bacterium]|jgi:amidase
MFNVRAIGYLRPPTAIQVKDYATRHHLDLSDEEAAAMVEAVSASLEVFTRVEELDEPSVPLKYRLRDPGRTPAAGEDPYNAFIRFCNVQGADSGPLHGKTVGVKDCIAVAGVPMTNGGRRTPVVVPTEDAVVVERLLDAGAVITGKTNLEDLALGLGEGSAFGASRNPIDPRFATGGSSSGSGAAVAAGHVDIALGADEGGSVRIPAAWCGLVGMKATHGLVPSYGLTYMDHTIDHIGPITKTVADNALVLEVIAGADWRDPQWVRSQPEAGQYTATSGAGIEGLKVGVVTEALEAAGCTSDVMDAFAAAQKRLIGLGAEVVDVSIPLWTDAGAIGLGVLGLGLYGMALSYGIGFSHMGRVDPLVTAAWAAQTQLQAADLPEMLKTTLITTDHVLECYQGVPIAKAQNLRIELKRQAVTALSDVDLLITPTIPKVPYELLERRAEPGEMAERMQLAMGATTNTMPLDLTGNPALTLPCGSGEHGLPVGLQIIGRHFGEEAIYRAAFAFEAASA